MEFIPRRVSIHTGMKARLHRSYGLLFGHIVLSCVPDNSFEFLTQHPIQRRPPLCRNHFAYLDQILVKADGNILFHGKTSPV